MKLLEYAIKAFNEGDDNYGEIPTGEMSSFGYSELLGGYMMHIILVEFAGTEKEHLCGSSIGFYTRKDNTLLEVVSGCKLPWYIEITPEIQAELDTAIPVQF
jgi:hypothetical protein